MSGATLPEEAVYRTAMDALTRGALVGTPGYGRTLTLLGRRRITIRFQVDVFTCLYGAGVVNYPDLSSHIARAVADYRGQL